MVLSQQDYDIAKQRIVNRFLKVNILNFDYKVVDEISGNVISFDVNIDADSDIRRTCNVEIVVTDSSFDIQAGNKIWLDKYIQPYIGIQNIRTGKVQWYNQGIYLIDNPTWQYDAETNRLSFSAVDLMAKMTGLRNGNLTGVPYVIPQGSNIREAIITTIGLAGFTKYVVDDCKQRDGTVITSPYEIKIEQGGTVYDILAELRDILPQYEMYFDVDGVFHYHYIPTGEDEPVDVDDDLWNAILSSEQITTDFESVKNVIEVWGRDMDTNQPHATSKEENPDSPFYIGGDIGEIRIVLSGGDYNNIETTDLAQQRADLELYWRCRMNDTITLSCLPVPWFDVNMIITHAPKGSKIQKRYMVKSIRADYGGDTGTMDISCMSLYAYYPPYDTTSKDENKGDEN